MGGAGKRTKNKGEGISILDRELSTFIKIIILKIRSINYLLTILLEMENQDFPQKTSHSQQLFQYLLLLYFEQGIDLSHLGLLKLSKVSWKGEREKRGW